MSQLSRAVSIHPYFKINPGEEKAFHELIVDFVTRTRTEGESCLCYDFTHCGDQAYCRELYADADAVLRHLENVGECIEASKAISEMYRLEFHGPAEEIEKLREALGDLEAEYYVRSNGVD
ncbi:putative quinol monooxygenase [Roseibacillus ishigakijimensis]|uniref:Quinol monooxygenase YgiN n=1 Tax=Roseibacillus ishigakijimensis TaxID=454146 RepID=A0A934RR65_9BACT|nr:hypothetical protein [Roseibacillus ishigakijimensis]MBK1835450.1 hypothetical protein [Roseibacillus ishigakijimensis]